MAQTTIQGTFLGDGTVTGAKIGADFISAQTALTSGLATTDEIIVSDAGVIKRMDISVIEIAATQITASGTLPALNGSNLTALNGTQITSGTVPAAQLGSNHDNARFLRGDNTWQAVSGGTTVNGTTDNAILTYINSSSEFTAEATLTFDGNNMLVGGSTGAKQLKIQTTSTNAFAELQLQVGANATAGGGIIRFYEGNGLGANNNMGLQLEYVAGTLSIGSSGSTGTHSYGAGGWRIRSAETQSNFFVGAAYEVPRDLIVIPNGYTAVLKPYQPGFQATNSSAQNHSNGGVDTIQFSSNHYGPGNCYNETGSTWNTIPAYSFKCPVAGMYLFTVYVPVTNIASGCKRYELKFTTLNSGGSIIREYNVRPHLDNGIGEVRVGHSQLIYLAKDDSVSVKGGPYGGTATTTNGGWFCGILLG